ncbi:hypothetical protein Xoosp13_2 [Xanthomonas phage Xoo-sp13]|nr:hypothetical protein Xoosp13_2 [Xanthomonas phage Xoo-sp13]
MSNRERRKSNRKMYQEITKSRKAKVYTMVGGLNISTSDAANITKMTRQSSRRFRYAASDKRSEQEYYAQDFYD